MRKPLFSLTKACRTLVLELVFFCYQLSYGQVYAYFCGYHVEMIYGVVSCSVLFAFIEFLSGMVSETVSPLCRHIDIFDKSQVDL